MTTRRPLVAALVTACGVSVTAGAFLPWVAARGSRPASGVTHTSLVGLRHFAYDHSATTTSFAVLIAAAGILVVIGGLAAWRVLAGLFAVVALLGAGLWAALNAHNYSPIDLRYNDLRLGAGLTIAGGLVALVASFWLRHRDVLANTSPWESVPTLGDDPRDDPAPRPDDGPPRSGAGSRWPGGRPPRSDGGSPPPPIRRGPGWQPGLRYAPARRPPWVQDRDGFRTPR